MDGRHVFSLMWLLLFVETVLCRPVLTRARRDIPVDVEAPAEVPEEHYGLVDDYGVVPKHPSFRHQTPRQQPQGLVEAGKSKRDEPDIGELYYDDLM